MPRATTLSFLGVAKEATPGTAVAATDFFPVSAFTPEDMYHYTPDKGIRGSFVKAYGEIPTAAWAQYGFAGDVFPDGIGYPLSSILGDGSFTLGSGAPNTWTFAVNNSASVNGQPPTFTMTDFNGFNARQFAYWRCSDLSFKFDPNGLLTYDAKGLASASATATTPTSSFSTETVIANWRGITTLGGTASSILQSGEVNISRVVSPILNLAGSQTPYKIWAGAVDVKGKLLLVYEDDTQLANYTGQTATSLDLNFSLGSGTGLRTIELHMSNVLYTNAKITRNEAKGYVELEVDYEAVANTTDIGATGGYSPIKVTLKNAKSTGTYF
ncbi:MAG: phage tail tube protein [Actinomycetota bacterium]